MSISLSSSLSSSLEEGKTYEMLENVDIKKNKYDLGTLEWNIRHSFISLRTLVKHQTLSPYICAKYVVFGGKDEKYADCTEDAWISTSEILYYQPHISMEEMHQAHAIADEEDEIAD
jgi:hypothetical protein